jgi:hypothetical protein
VKNDNENGELAEEIVLTELPEETRMVNGLALRPSTAAARDPDAVVHDADAEASKYNIPELHSYIWRR